MTPQWVGDFVCYNQYLDIEIIGEALQEVK